MRNDCKFMSDELKNNYWKPYTVNLSSDKTRNMYWSDIINFLDFVEKDFLEITQEDVDKYYSHHMQNENIKLATLQKKFRELSGFSDFVEKNIPPETDRDISFKNYFYPKLADLNNKVKMEKNHIPSIQEMDQFLIEAKQDIMHYTIFSLIYRCAVRPTESFNIKASDFSESDGCRYLRIRNNNHRRIIPLPDDVVKILDQYNEFRDKTATFYFYKNATEKLSVRTMQRVVRKYSLAAGIAPITMYGMRDAAVALMCTSCDNSSLIADECGLTERGVKRYENIVPAYMLQDSAINTVNIRILPADKQL